MLGKHWPSQPTCGPGQFWSNLGQTSAPGATRRHMLGNFGATFEPPLAGLAGGDFSGHAASNFSVTFGELRPLCRKRPLRGRLHDRPGGRTHAVKPGPKLAHIRRHSADNAPKLVEIGTCHAKSEQYVLPHDRPILRRLRRTSTRCRARVCAPSYLHNDRAHPLRAERPPALDSWDAVMRLCSPCRGILKRAQAQRALEGKAEQGKARQTPTGENPRRGRPNRGRAVAKGGCAEWPRLRGIVRRTPKEDIGDRRRAGQGKAHPSGTTALGWRRGQTTEANASGTDWH